MSLKFHVIRYISALKYCSLKTLFHKCQLRVLKCPLSVLERCLSYNEFSYSKMTEKWPGPTEGVRLIEVSVKRELTVLAVTFRQGMLRIMLQSCFFNSYTTPLTRCYCYKSLYLLLVRSTCFSCLSSFT